MGARAGLALAVFGGLLVFVPGLNTAYALPKLLLMSAGLTLAWRRARAAAPTPADAPVWGCLLAAAVSTAFSPDRPQSVYGAGLQPYHGLLALLLYAAAFRLGAAQEEPLAQEGTDWWAAAAGLMGLFCVLQAAGAVPAPWDAMDRRSLATTGNPTMAGACLAAALPLAASAALRRRNWGWLTVAGVCAGLAFVQSRGALLGAAAGAALYAVLSGRAAAGRQRAALAALFVAAGAAAAAVWARQMTSDPLRLEIWRASLSALGDRPLVGFGPDNFSLALRQHKTLALLGVMRHATAMESSGHNDLLQAAVTTGLAGLGAYLWLLAAVVAGLRRRPAVVSVERWAAGAGALLAVAVCQKFNPAPNELLFLSAWLAGSLLKGEPADAPAQRRAWSAASAALTAAFACFCVADRAAWSCGVLRRAGDAGGAVNAAVRAARLWPAKLEHQTLLSETLLEAAARVQDPRLASSLALASVGNAEKAARQHAGNPQAYELYGSALLAAAALDSSFARRAAVALDRALELDPLHDYTLNRRLDAARTLGDAETARRLEERLKAVEGAAAAGRRDPAPGPAPRR